MPTVDVITRLIFDVIDEFNEFREDKPKIEKLPNAPLFGADAPLDSLDLARLIINVEDRVADELGALIALADEKAMSQKNSPFRSVRSLATYIDSLVNEPSHA